jgi:two-component system, cell cycle response regulator DivK
MIERRTESNMMNKIARDILAGWDVVVVDDDPSSLDIAQMLLRHHGARVYTATNGQEGLDIIMKTYPRFVVTDISMPVMDGWGMIAALKSNSRTAIVPIIALTSHAMVSDRQRAMAAGCHNYMSKPLTPATFIGELLSLLVNIPELGLTVAQLEGDLR